MGVEDKVSGVARGTATLGIIRKRSTMKESCETAKLEDVNRFSGSLLTVRPGLVVPADWLRNDELCIEYRNRFGVPVSLPFWFANSMGKAVTMLHEALDKGRRRWILECGPWAGNPPIEEFKDLIADAGHSLEGISLANTANSWLDPVEWIEVAS